jgi:leucyl-tRNA synthetase
MINKYGADASRIALADAGDGVSDANFDETVADTNILRLSELRKFCEEVLSDVREGPTNDFLDRLFDNEMNSLVHECLHHYENTDYKLALKSALYDFIMARDFYREASAAAGLKMHKDTILKYIELQALLITPIAPHWSEYIWLEVLKKPSTIQNERFPEVPLPDPALSATREYVRITQSNITAARAGDEKKKAKGKDVGYDLKKPMKLTIYSAAKFPAWQEKYVDLMAESWDQKTMSVDDKAMNGKIAKMGEMKKAMPFVQNLKRRLVAGEKPEVVFSRKLAFDEIATLKNMIPGIAKAARLAVVDVVKVDDGGKTGTLIEGDKQVTDLALNAEQAVPGIPTFKFENAEV